jgi:murein DD-endopeptidase MepM/ murein hydrolase activator NlpD
MPVMPRRTRRGRTSLALLLVATLAAGVELPARADPGERLERIERRRQRLERTLERVDAIGDRVASTVAALDARRARLEARVGLLDRRIDDLDAEIEVVGDRLTRTQQRLAAATERLEEIQRRLAARQDLYARRAVDAYKAGPAAAAETLLSSESLSSLLDRYAYYESVFDADTALLDEIEALEREAQSRRAEIERRKVQIAADKLVLSRERTALAELRSHRAEALAARRAAVARKKALLGRIRGRQRRLVDAERQLALESARIHSLLAAGLSGSALRVAAGGQLSWPAAGPLTSGFGMRNHPILGGRRMHTGIDISAPYGAPVWAADGGRVAYVGTLSGYGSVVAIDHGGSLATTYNHLSGFFVAPGEAVARGQHIAAVGCSGYCTGPHLHFEVRVNGAPVDPLPYLR